VTISSVRRYSVKIGECGVASVVLRIEFDSAIPIIVGYEVHINLIDMGIRDDVRLMFKCVVCRKTGGAEKRSHHQKLP
jgi:hypothetical protein